MNKELIYNILSKYNFNKFQKEEIEYGLEKNLNVEIYTKPEFNWL